MHTDEPDYFAWVKTGQFAMILSAVMGPIWLLSLVGAINKGVTGAIILFGVLVVVSGISFVAGVRQYRAYSAARQQ